LRWRGRGFSAARIWPGGCIRASVIDAFSWGYRTVVVEDCCAAATAELHAHELAVINMIYCHVATLDECVGFFAAR